MSIYVFCVFFVKYSYLPASFMESIFVPLIKNKRGDLSDINNYRAIALSSSLSKVFESLIFSYLDDHSAIDNFQFGFQPGFSTGICTHVFKQTVDYFRTHTHGSHVFVCFVDFTKAFDSVNYWKLFRKLLLYNINPTVVSVLAYWYSHQICCVRWGINFQIGLEWAMVPGKAGSCLPNCLIYTLEKLYQC